MDTRKLLSTTVLYGLADVIVMAVGGFLLLTLYTRTLSQPEFGTYVIVRTNTEIVALEGTGRLSGITVRDRTTGAQETLTPAGVFVFIGLSPNAGWLPAEIARDQAGFIITSPTLETSMPGVFTAGDVRQGSTKQAASATGEGATAALMIREYLKGM